MESSIFDGMNIDDIERQRRLKHLNSEISDCGMEINFNLSAEEWKKLTIHIRSLPLQLKEKMVNQLPKNEKMQFISDIDEKALVDIGTSYNSMEDVKEILTPIILEKVGDKDSLDKVELDSSFKAYVNMCYSSEDSQKAMIEYYSQFIPSPDKCKSTSLGALSKIFRAIVELIRKIVKYAKEGVKEAWVILKNPEAYYVELRGKIINYVRANPNHVWARYLFFLPDLFRLYVRLLIDNRVPSGSKMAFFGAIIYLVVPTDFIPEAAVGPVGYIEDVYFMVIAITNMLNTNHVPREVLVDHWLGSKEELDFLIKASMTLNDNIDIFRYLGKWFKERTHQQAF